MQKNPSVSAIIPFYNNEKFFKRNIESILNQTYPIKEIILVNDGSKQRDAQLAREYAKKYKKIKLIEFKENKGQSFARNAGLKLSKSDIVFFVEGDAVFDKNYLKNIVEQLVKNKDKKVAGSLGIRVPIDYNPKNIVQRMSKDVFELLPKIRAPLNVWVYWRKVLEEVGGFSEEITRVGEDVEMADRIKKLGYEMYWCEKSKFYHDEPKTLWQVIKSAYRNGKKILPFYLKNYKNPFYYKNNLFHFLWLISFFLTPISLIPFIFFTSLWIYFYFKRIKTFLLVDKNWRILLFPIIDSIRSFANIFGILVSLFS